MIDSSLEESTQTLEENITSAIVKETYESGEELKKPLEEITMEAEKLDEIKEASVDLNKMDVKSVMKLYLPPSMANEPERSVEELRKLCQDIFDDYKMACEREEAIKEAEIERSEKEYIQEEQEFLEEQKNERLPETSTDEKAHTLVSSNSKISFVGEIIEEVKESLSGSKNNKNQANNNERKMQYKAVNVDIEDACDEETTLLDQNE